MSSHVPLRRPPLSIEIDLPEAPAAIAVVTMTGEIDRDNCSEVRQAVIDVLHRRRGGQITLDMSQVTFLDSAGIRALLIGRRTAHQQGSVLEIERAHDNVRQVLTITGLLDVFCLK